MLIPGCCTLTGTFSYPGLLGREVFIFPFIDDQEKNTAIIVPLKLKLLGAREEIS